MEKVKRTTEIASNLSRGCEHCDYSIGAIGESDIAGSINHYIEAHGYRLLHVGSETNHGPDGKPWQHTVAILGHDNPPPIKPPAKVQIAIDLGGIMAAKPK